MKWISVQDRPLVIPTRRGWECTKDGEQEFLAALQYNDSVMPNEKLWWIKHCVIEDEVGLCIVGDDGENIPAGWDVTDITYWMPIKPPKK